MQSGIDGKRIAALIADGFEEAELVEPRRVLEEAGAIVTIVGIDDKAKAKIRSKRGLDDGAGSKAEEVVADCTAEDFDGLLIPGGYSPDKLRGNREVQRFVKEFAIDLGRYSQRRRPLPRSADRARRTLDYDSRRRRHDPFQSGDGRETFDGGFARLTTS